MIETAFTQARLRALLTSQKFAVLATSHTQQPYASLVAFAATADLRDPVERLHNAARYFAKTRNIAFDTHLLPSRHQHSYLVQSIIF